jgi:hypothetical protein
VVNKSKAIGTRAESAVLKQVKPYFPAASRNALAGQNDLGDIGHCGEFVFEVKGGEQAKNITDGRLADWMGQAAREAKNAGVRFGVLVVQRRGVNYHDARRWWVYLTLQDFAEICSGYYMPARFATVRLELGDFLDLVADQGVYTTEEIDHAPEVVMEPVRTESIAVIGSDDGCRTRRGPCRRPRGLGRRGRRRDLRRW